MKEKYCVQSVSNTGKISKILDFSDIDLDWLIHLMSNSLKEEFPILTIFVYQNKFDENKIKPCIILTLKEK